MLILVSSKLKEFLDNNFEFDENGARLVNSTENAMGKGENARHEQFLLFSQNFQDLYSRYVKTKAYLRKKLIHPFPNYKLKEIADDNLMKMAESSSNRSKTLCEKEELLIMSNFSFSHGVFVPQTRKNQGYYKNLTLSQTTNFTIF